MGKGKWGSSALATPNNSFPWILILHPQGLVLVVLNPYSYLCIWMIITHNNYHKSWGLLRSLTEHRFRPMIKFSYVVYMKGTLHRVQYYRLELFSCFLFGIRIFLKCFQGCSCSLQDELGAKGFSRKVALPGTWIRSAGSISSLGSLVILWPHWNQLHWV